MRIEAKLILISLAASLGSVVVACTLFIVYDIDNSRRAMKEDLSVVAEGIAINSTPALEFESLDSARDILGALRADPHIEVAAIYDRQGNSVDYRRADLDASAAPASSRREGAFFEDGKLRIYRHVLREGNILGTVFIQSDVKELRDRLDDYARVVVIVGLASLLPGLLLASQLQELISRPIRHLAEVEMLAQIQQRGGELMPAKEAADAAGKQLLALVNDILDLSMIEAGKMELDLETFDVKALVDVVRATIHPLIECNANVLEVHCPADIGAMQGDVTRVRLVLFNLLSNASRFTEKGTVGIHVSRDVKPDGYWMTFRVTDTGIGLTPDQLDRLFQAPTQADASRSRKYGGAGLGLVSCRRSCQMMGGDVSVASNPGGGSVFIVSLPARINRQKGDGVGISATESATVHRG